jgi:hypothetical protein|tara:strand:+ start:226 stop:489 length:264 start_codon:yes stop_codon:yes gene_type:complete
VRDVWKRRDVPGGHDINRRLRLQRGLLQEPEQQLRCVWRRDIPGWHDINRRLRLQRQLLQESEQAMRYVRERCDVCRGRDIDRRLRM